MARIKQSTARTTGCFPRKHLVHRAAKKQVTTRSFCDLDYIAGKQDVLAHLDTNGYDKDTLLDMTKDLFWIADDLQLNPNQTASMITQLYFLHKKRNSPDLDLAGDISTPSYPTRYTVKLPNSEEVLYFRSLLNQDQSDDDTLYYCEECGENRHYQKKQFINHAKEHFD